MRAIRVTTLVCSLALSAAGCGEVASAGDVPLDASTDAASADAAPRIFCSPDTDDAFGPSPAGCLPDSGCQVECNPPFRCLHSHDNVFRCCAIDAQDERWAPLIDRTGFCDVTRTRELIEAGLPRFVVSP